MKKFLKKERRLKEVEKRILEIKSILGDEDRRSSIAKGISMPAFEKRLEIKNRPLKNELEALETERSFLLDDRNNLFWRLVWNVAVPIIVSALTALLIS